MNIRIFDRGSKKMLGIFDAFDLLRGFPGADCYGFIDDLTVHLSSSLKDAYGKEIFEGDILRVNFNSNDTNKHGVVKFENGCFICVFRYAPFDDLIGGKIRLFTYKVSSINNECDVAGNILENPELLP